jgi:hypothetical protein
MKLQLRSYEYRRLHDVCRDMAQRRSYEYRRLHHVCRDMTQRSDSEDLQDRWLKMAQAFLDCAGGAEMIEHSCATQTVTVELALPTSVAVMM